MSKKSKMKAKSKSKTAAPETASPKTDISTLEKIAERAIYYSTQMINIANNRDADKGDPKVGGHPAACSSSAHILGALHMMVKGPSDFLAVKPHASPMDHSYNHLLRMFLHKDGTPFTEAEAKKVMTRLRAFMDPSDPNAEPAFQSYHAVWDPDAYNFLPSGSVGIPPVVSTFTALGFRFAKDHGFEVPEDMHFWSVIGDSEFREGSLAECMPDTAERELGNVTWIIDYNRQNLDGTRIKNEDGMSGTDANRIEYLGLANGWRVIQVRHGRKRLALFDEVGEELKVIFDNLSDFELQALILKNDGKTVRNRLIELDPSLKSKLGKITDTQLSEALLDLGGHDLQVLSEALESCKGSTRPTLVIAHTIKGWGIESLKAKTGNHSMLADEKEIDELRKKQKISEGDLFELPSDNSPEGQYLKARGEFLRAGRDAQFALKKRNQENLAQGLASIGQMPSAFNINLKLSPWANTQWMWGQLASKINRIAGMNDPEDGVHPPSKSAPLTDEEKLWALAASHTVTLAPDVGTSTNLNPSMDGKIYGPDIPEDFEAKYKVKDVRRPDLVPLEKQAHRHLRFEIEEGNAMSCLGALGKIGDHIGVKILPMMTVYDFFIKRALDQLFYNLYWKSSFILVGTPSGVTLSPEGAQHSWKSDIQIPNGITWEPAFSVEMDWILADAINRHFTGDNMDREGVLIRAVTRGIEQKLMIENLRKQVIYTDTSDEEIMERTRQNVLNGGYWLVNWEGYEGYHPGDNVVHLFVMGALAPEAVAASEKLMQEHGIFANVCVVTSPDLLMGTLARNTKYSHLRQTLGVNANLYIRPTQAVGVGQVSVGAARMEVTSRSDLLAMRGSRIPIVAICDGEAGLLDNIGSIVGVPQDTLAVRKHSKSGKPNEVYKYHHLDADSIAETAIEMLEQAASEEIFVTTQVAEQFAQVEESAPAYEATEADSDNTRH